MLYCCRGKRQNSWAWRWVAVQLAVFPGKHTADTDMHSLTSPAVHPRLSPHPLVCTPAQPLNFPPHSLTPSLLPPHCTTTLLLTPSPPHCYLFTSSPPPSHAHPLSSSTPRLLATFSPTHLLALSTPLLQLPPHPLTPLQLPRPVPSPFSSPPQLPTPSTPLLPLPPHPLTPSRYPRPASLPFFSSAGAAALCSTSPT